MGTATMGKDLVGTVVDGRFTLLEWLGGSAGGEVFLTEADGQRAAIKLIAADAADADARIAAWAATSGLSHPHLLRLLGTGRCEGGSGPLLYAVTEYSGELLAQIIPERPLTAAEAREMVDPILDALSYLHSKGIVHGHLKPSNIMVVDDQLKISTDNLQLAGKSAGFPRRPDIYRAPEFAEGRVLQSSDFWSLGATLVESLTQQPPVWLRPEEINPRVPQSIEEPFAAIARECLRSDPARRCTLAGFRALLNPAPMVADAAREEARIPAGLSPGRFPVKSVVVIAVVVAAVAGWMLMRLRRPEPATQTEDQPAAVASAPATQKPTPMKREPVPSSEAPASAVPETSQSSTDAAQSPTQAPVPTAETPAAANPVSEAGAGKGAVLERVSPDVLPSARASINHQVNVSVKVNVDAAGNVSNAEFESAGPSRYFARQAMEAAQRWKFAPAQADGKPVSSSWVVRFHFTQAGTDITPVEVSP